MSNKPITKQHVGSVVLCVLGHEGAGLVAGRRYTLALWVDAGQDYRGQLTAPGVVVYDIEHEANYPHVWNTNHFVKEENT